MISTVAGVAIVAFSNNQDAEGTNPVIGDIFGVVGSILLGLYSTMLVKCINPEIEDKISFFNVLAFIGILCLITFWPLLLIFHFTDIEEFQLPPNVEVWGFWAINIVFGTLLFNYFWGRATLLIGPLLANTSVILVVPISMVIDNFFIRTRFTWIISLGLDVLCRHTFDNYWILYDNY
mmetsp:Transcript_25130/g.22274  ORF Transcript_25130/g.22274 Transcript_25130/m.22274 type:complete len:178 (+) Transcript_25130:40-573(+)